MNQTAIDIDLENLFLNLNAGIYFVDKMRRITFWNKKAEQITGFNAAEIIGSHCFDNLLMHIDEQGRNLCIGSCPLTDCMEVEKEQEAKIYLHHKDGHRIPVLVKVTPLQDRSGEVIGAAELFVENSERMYLEERIQELENLSMIDELTRLPNRRFMSREFERAFDEMKRDGLMFGVIFLDIDDFKAFNDKHGHLNGDRLLIAVAATLESVSRPYDVFGRWGGEEFVGIIRHADQQDLIRISNRYRVMVEKSTIRLPHQFKGATVSIGATIVKPGDTMETVLSRADQLMYKSKKKGKNQVTYG